jgi:hypothetical protein
MNPPKREAGEKGNAMCGDLAKVAAPHTSATSELAGYEFAASGLSVVSILDES